MADLRARLQEIETATPPDLWAGIEARAEEEVPEMDGTDVVAFRKEGSEWGRRAVTALVAAAVFVVGFVVVWRAFQPGPTTLPPGNQLPDGWVRCTNNAYGYSIGYPGDWYTTDVIGGEQSPRYVCRSFSTDPFGPEGHQVVEGWGYPVEIRIGPGPGLPYYDSFVSPEDARIVDRDELEIEGHPAVRLEYETLEDVVGEPGLHYDYVIELADLVNSLVIHTTETRGLASDYAENKAIVDQMVDTLRIFPPVREIPADWTYCTNELVGYSVPYPADWYTTDLFMGERDPANACRWFSPEPFGPEGNEVSEGWGYPLEVDVRGPLDETVDELLDPEVARIEGSEYELVIDGHRAVRIGYVSFADVLAEAGRHHAYVIEVDQDTSLVVHTTETRGIEGNFEENREIVEQAGYAMRIL